jgi:class 3 adenylate cyclase/pimeloyl-ACP methyl ester carboxylesterase
MEPRIQYAKTSDGVSIAYTVLGSGGKTLIVCPNVWGDLTMYRAVSLFRAWWDAVAARGHRVIIYDSRNMGESEHRDLDYSDEGRLADLEAVVSRAGAERFCLYGFLHGCLPVTEYAVANPERVDRLVLINPFARGEDYYTAVPEMAMVERLGEGEPRAEELLALSIANLVTGFANPELARQIAEGMRSSMSVKKLTAFSSGTRRSDISEALPRITQPALVIFLYRFMPDLLPLSREVARLIPTAELVEFHEGRGAGDLNVDVVGIVDAFLRGEEAVAAPTRPLTEQTQTEATSATRTDLTVILFADIADSTALTEKMGDAAFRNRARVLDESLRTIIRDHDGTPIEGKLLGDGVLATFTSARQAIEAALSCGAMGDKNGLPLHLGLHAGDVISEEGNVYGGAVNIAARISGESAAGEVLVSQTVRDLARTSAGVSYDDCGERELKGVSEAVRVWRVIGRAMAD